MHSEAIVAVLGHIDHGKTALVKALSGIECDTRPEERERGMTMEPGFAYLREGDRTVALIDLPGHERYALKTATGLLGATAAMIVVDAKEGVKPQTLSHLKMARWMGIEAWMPVLSRCDLYEGDAQERMAAILEDLRGAIRGLGEPTGRFAVSIDDDFGIQRLREALLKLSAKPAGEGAVSMRIDRLFRRKGSGTVVTGTLVNGSISPQTRLFAPEANERVRIKGLQRHGQAAQRLDAPCRAAAAIDGAVKRLERGMLLTSDAALKACERIEGVLIGDRFDALPPHGGEVSLVIGAGRWPGRIYYYDAATVRLVLQKPAALRFGERALLFHREAPVAGVEILSPLYDPLRPGAKRRLLSALKARDFAAAFMLLAQNHPRGFGLLNASCRFGLDRDEAAHIVRSIPGFFFDESAMKLYGPQTIEALRNEITRIFAQNRHAAVSVRMLRRRFAWAGEGLLEDLLQTLEQSGLLAREGRLYHHSGLERDRLQEETADLLLRRLEAAGIRPPAPNRLFDEMAIDRGWGKTLLQALSKEGRVVALGEGRYAAKGVAEAFAPKLLEAAYEGVDIQKMKALFHLSRKEAVAWLEWLDSFNDVTNKEGVRYYEGRRGRESNPPSDGHPPDRRV